MNFRFLIFIYEEFWEIEHLQQVATKQITATAVQTIFKLDCRPISVSGKIFRSFDKQTKKSMWRLEKSKLQNMAIPNV